MDNTKLEELFSSVDTTVDFSITSVINDISNIGNIIGNYEESAGKTPADTMTFDDYYILTDRVNKVLIHSFAKVLKKSLRLCLTEQLLASGDED
jgi:hypothetical protein